MSELPTGKFAVAELTGGLGNQLFQYATARALCLREARTLHFAWYLARGNTARRFMLDAYPLPAGVTPAPLAPRALRALGLRSPLLGRKTGRLWRLARGRLHQLREPSFAYTPLASRARRVVLEGYFQSWRYFDDCQGELRATLVPRQPPNAQSGALLRQIARTNAVCVHVRRGDYVANPLTAAYHGVAPLAYYEAAVPALGEAGRAAQFYVFSDDPAWVKQNLRLPGDTVYVDHNGPDVPWEDLRLMAACRHFVIANSSLSWWGAWLGAHPEKRVVAPARWFAGADADTRDLCPPAWLRL